MKERPILFSGEMVRAILEGRKTQTRRIVKINGDIPKTITDKAIAPYNGTKEQLVNAMVYAGHRCKYGRQGDRLWVKETFSAHGVFGAMGRKVYRADLGDGAQEPLGLNWKPSIFIPRCASRITLEIVSVRVERLQDISEEEAKAEGVKGALVSEDGVHCSFKIDYATLWDEINGKGAWASNPWVWVIEFKRLEGGAK